MKFIKLLHENWMCFVLVILFVFMLTVICTPNLFSVPIDYKYTVIVNDTGEVYHLAKEENNCRIDDDSITFKIDGKEYFIAGNITVITEKVNE